MRAWLIIGLFAVYPFHTQNASAQKHEQRVNYSPAPAFFFTVQPASAPEQGSTDDQQPQTLCERFVDALVSQWPLVAIGTATLIVIGYQAKEMARATNEMKKSTAEIQKQTAAIEKQGVAMVNAERGWVQVDLDWQNPQYPLFKPHNGKTTIHLTMTVWNHGKTPCWITERSIQQGVFP